MNLNGFLAFMNTPLPEVRATADRLWKLNVFPSASRADLKRIARVSRIVTVPEGWSLIVERTPADKAYVVLGGQLSVQHGAERFAEVRTGQLVGEMAIVNHELRNATVVAVTDLELLQFTAGAMEELLEFMPAFRDAVEVTIASRVGSV